MSADFPTTEVAVPGELFQPSDPLLVLFGLLKIMSSGGFCESRDVLLGQGKS